MTMRTTALLLSLLVPTQGCTTLLLGKDATVDGSVIATHSNDGEAVTDPRLVRIPAADWPAGSTRPVWPSPEDYPRYVGAARGAPPYFAAAGENETAPVGAIAQVNHTYAYFEETYGALSEVQLGIGESTCSGAFAAVSVTTSLVVSVTTVSTVRLPPLDTSVTSPLPVCACVTVTSSVSVTYTPPAPVTCASSVAIVVSIGLTDVPMPLALSAVNVPAVVTLVAPAPASVIAA